LTIECAEDGKFLKSAPRGNWGNCNSTAERRRQRRRQERGFSLAKIINAAIYQIAVEPTVPRFRLLADVDVGSDFHGEADFFKLRFNPYIHNNLVAETKVNLFSGEMQYIFGDQQDETLKFSP
jgi:hypothetical protein